MRHTRSDQGFTLAETAIAMLVVSVGILSMFAMFPLGLENTRNTAADVESAVFAEKVFNAYRAKFGAGPWIGANQVDLDVNGNAYLTATASIKANTGSTQLFSLEDNVSQVENNVWYDLTVAPPTGLAQDVNSRLLLTLTVWVQKTQPAAGAKDGRVFYTEILRQVPL